MTAKILKKERNGKYWECLLQFDGKVTQHATLTDVRVRELEFREKLREHLPSKVAKALDSEFSEVMNAQYAQVCEDMEAD